MNGYGSRKFIITAVGMGLGIFLMLFGAFFDVPDGYWAALPACFILLAAGISGYNWANAKGKSNGNN